MTLDYNGGMMWGNNYAGSWLWMAAMTVVVLGVIIGVRSLLSGPSVAQGQRPGLR